MENKKREPIKIEDIENVINVLKPKEAGIAEIKVIASQWATKGIGVLILHPDDFEEYKKSFLTREQ